MAGCRVQVPSPHRECWGRSKGRERCGWRVLAFIHFINRGCSQAGIFSFFSPLCFTHKAGYTPKMTKMDLSPHQHLPPSPPRFVPFWCWSWRLTFCLLHVEIVQQKGSVVGAALNGIWSLSHQWSQTACLFAAGSLSVLMEYCIQQVSNKWENFLSCLFPCHNRGSVRAGHVCVLQWFIGVSFRGQFCDS